MFDVVGVGANSIDFVYRLASWPRPEAGLTKVPVHERSEHCGGQTATAMAACARLGLRAKYVGVVGSDAYGGRITTQLAGLGVDVSGVVRRDGAANASAAILIDERTGERIVLWDRSPALALRFDELPRAPIASARVVHIDDVDEDAAIATARLAQDAGVPVTTDFDRVTTYTGELLSLVTHPILAEQVPKELTGAADVEQALRELRRQHAGLLTVTLGHLGAAALDGDRFMMIPGHRIRAVDTTGAGDVFRGAFVYGLVQGWEAERIVRFANAAAAVSCTKPGAIDGAPPLDEVWSLLGSPSVGRGS